jgi:hypothetical protein
MDHSEYWIKALRKIQSGYAYKDGTSSSAGRASRSSTPNSTEKLRMMFSTVRDHAAEILLPHHGTFETRERPGTDAGALPSSQDRVRLGLTHLQSGAWQVPCPFPLPMPPPPGTPSTLPHWLHPTHTNRYPENPPPPFSHVANSCTAQTSHPFPRWNCKEKMQRGCARAFAGLRHPHLDMRFSTFSIGV